MARIKIEIVSDVVCPWCYIGHARLQKALKILAGEGNDFDVSYLPFELNPGTGPDGLDRRAHLLDKFGGEERYNALQDHVAGVASAEGIDFRMDVQKTIPNTRKAHVLLEYAATMDLQLALAEKLFRAYFTERTDLTNEDSLVNLGVDVGLEEGVIRNALSDLAASKRIRDREEEMYRLGISGVPFYIINGKHGISGAQPTDIFVQALRELRAQTENAEACRVETKDC